MSMSQDKIRQWLAEYHPCANGVHVFHPEMGEFGGSTVANFPNATLELFAKHSCAGDEWDLMCDLMENNESVDVVKTWKLSNASYAQLAFIAASERNSPMTTITSIGNALSAVQDNQIARRAELEALKLQLQTNYKDTVDFIGERLRLALIELDTQIAAIDELLGEPAPMQQAAE
jgi:hypothetical protein